MWLAVRHWVTRILREQGYAIIEAANGSEALHLVQERGDEQIDLLVVDVVMPQIGGVELADRLKAIYPSLTVIFISGYTDDAFADHSFQKSGDAFLPKPFSAEQLRHKIREVLDQP
jgi:CheY-like chemotaxis protein